MSPHSDLRALFEAHFGHGPTIFAVAPGRVNLIGEHTDYNDGFVFPGAIDRGLYIAARVTDGKSQVVSRQLGAGDGFDAASVAPGGGMESWSKYPAGMAWALRQHTGVALPNIEAYIDSDIPIGSGVSSSAAIEMAFGVVWNAIANLTLANAELARLGQVCENQFVGVNSGIMDQMASAMGREGMAMFLDTRTLEIAYAPVPAGTTVVLCDTKKPRALTDSAYNERRSQCEEASRILGVEKLRDANLEQLEAAKGQMSDVVYRRARHVITENDRCERFKEVLDSGDLDEAGRLMRASHESLRDDYEVSCRELDAMADAAAAAPGCIGARMTGAGFGGACVALVRESELEAFIKSTLAAYDKATGLGGEAMACRLVEGARVL
jgi:galactokinase